MFTQLYLNDSFMIRKIIVAAVPAALVAVGMSLATSQPASSQRRGGFVLAPGMQNFQLSSGGQRNPGGANTNQVYPNNRSGMPGLDINNTTYGVHFSLTGHAGRK